MKKSILSFFIGVALTFGIISMFTCCIDTFDQSIDFIVDERLKNHVNKFYDEAQARGIHLQRENLVIRVEDYKKNVSKKCGCQRLIIISKNSYDFFTSGHWVKGDSAYYGLENLVFHELGHSLLKRPHCDPCESIMAAGSSHFIYVKDMNKRALLVDELFGIESKE